MTDERGRQIIPLEVSDLFYQMTALNIYAAHPNMWQERILAVSALIAKGDAFYPFATAEMNTIIDGLLNPKEPQ